VTKPPPPPTGKPPGNLVYFATRTRWRRWLRANYQKSAGVWLVYYKKGSGQPRISYNDAVEEALCFGWIDSNVRSLDSERFAQHFTPRKPGSQYSQANKERLRRLVAAGKVAASVKRHLPALGRVGRLEIPSDIHDAIRQDKQAWRHFQRFSASYKRIRIAYIEGARRRPLEFKKRLAHFVRMAAQNKQIGFGGIDKYY
jgi:uncharacterized protein YdeI (YjbR/CyaY-like superfamily)